MEFPENIEYFIGGWFTKNSLEIVANPAFNIGPPSWNLEVVVIIVTF